MFAGKSKTRREDKYKFITYILNKMKLPTEHRKTGKKNEERRLKERHPGTWVPKTPLCTRVVRDLRFYCVETARWHANGSKLNLPKGTKYKEIIGKIQRILHSWWKKRSSHTDLEHRQFCDERQQRT